MLNNKLSSLKDKLAAQAVVPEVTETPAEVKVEEKKVETKVKITK